MLMPRYKPLLIVSSLLLLTACAKVTSPDATTADLKTVQYNCDRGNPIQVIFSSKAQTATLIRGNDRIELPQAPTASGFLYRNHATSIAGKGQALTLTIGRMAPIQCTAAATEK